MPKAQQYIPDRGHVIWIDFNPQMGHEQAKRRSALILSPEKYNALSGLAIMCPITSQSKGVSFEVLIPDGEAVSGVILSDQVKSLDWQARNAEYMCDLPRSLVLDVLAKLNTLLR